MGIVIAKMECIMPEKGNKPFDWIFHLKDSHTLQDSHTEDHCVLV